MEAEVSVPASQMCKTVRIQIRIRLLRLWKLSRQPIQGGFCL